MTKKDPVKLIGSLAVVFAFPLIDPGPILLFYILVGISVVLLLTYSFALRRVTKALAVPDADPLNVVAQDIVSVRLKHRTTLVKVTATWLSSAVVLAYSTWVLKFGLGSEWAPFFRTITIRKGELLYGYTMFDGPFVISGFLFISGLVWMPMYYFFEGLTAKQRIAALRKGETQHA